MKRKLITTKWVCPKCGHTETWRTHIKPEAVFHPCPQRSRQARGVYMKEVKA